MRSCCRRSLRSVLFPKPVWCGTWKPVGLEDTGLSHSANSRTQKKHWSRWTTNGWARARSGVTGPTKRDSLLSRNSKLWPRWAWLRVPLLATIISRLTARTVMTWLWPKPRNGKPLATSVIWRRILPRTTWSHYSRILATLWRLGCRQTEDLHSWRWTLMKMQQWQFANWMAIKSMVVRWSAA